MHKNQVELAHQALATLKPSAFQMTEPMMRILNPLLAGLALRIELREESISEVQFSVVDI